MKQRLKPLAAGLCLLGLISVPVFAVTKHENVNTRIHKLEREVAALRAEKSHKSIAHKKSHTVTRHTHQTVVTDEEHRLPGPTVLPTSGTEYMPVDLDVPGQSFVSTGPYIGIPIEYNGSNLIINSPSVNRDVALLKVRKNILTRLKDLGIESQPDHSHVLLSGIIEGQAFDHQPGVGHQSTDIDITSAGLEAYILTPSPWVSGLISLNYDNNSGTATGSLANRSRVQNSRVFVNQAFVTLGDFMQSPYYATLGQIYVPFGTYSTTMVSSSLPKAIFRTKARAAVVGFQQQEKSGFYGSAYTFHGDTRTSSTSRINNGGLNVGYHFNNDNIDANFGGGVIANVADSVGMQNTGNGPGGFDGFGSTLTGGGVEMIAHRVPAYDIRGILAIGKKVDFIAEYVAATKAFSPGDLSMNTHGAKPRALHAEAVYTFQGFSKPTSVGVGYDMTKDALALGMPAKRYSAVINTSLWRDTLESLELRHDVNYSSNSVANGNNPATVPPITGPGKPDNAVTAQIEIYF